MLVQACYPCAPVPQEVHQRRVVRNGQYRPRRWHWRPSRRRAPREPGCKRAIAELPRPRPQQDAGEVTSGPILRQASSFAGRVPTLLLLSIGPPKGRAMPESSDSYRTIRSKGYTLDTLVALLFGAGEHMRPDRKTRLLVHYEWYPSIVSLPSEASSWSTRRMQAGLLTAM